MPEFSKSDPATERKLRIETLCLGRVDTSRWRWFSARTFQEELLRALDYELPLHARMDALETCKTVMGAEQELEYNRRR